MDFVIYYYPRTITTTASDTTQKPVTNFDDTSFWSLKVVPYRDDKSYDRQPEFGFPWNSCLFFLDFILTSLDIELYLPIGQKE